MKKLWLFLILAAMVAQGDVGVLAQSLVDRPDVTRQEAITRLTQLIDFYNIDLTEAEEDRVITVCRQIQSNNLEPLRSKTEDLAATYEATVNSVELTVGFIANSLREMSEDASGMDLVIFHLQRDTRELQESVEIYQRVLDEVLIIDCQVFPEAFTAGLTEARERARVVEADAQDIKNTLDEELSQSLSNVRSRIQAIEGRAQ